MCSPNLGFNLAMGSKNLHPHSEHLHRPHQNGGFVLDIDQGVTGCQFEGVRSDSPPHCILQVVVVTMRPQNFGFSHVLTLGPRTVHNPGEELSWTATDSTTPVNMSRSIYNNFTHPVCLSSLPGSSLKSVNVYKIWLNEKLEQQKICHCKYDKIEWKARTAIQRHGLLLVLPWTFRLPQREQWTTVRTTARVSQGLRILTCSGYRGGML